VKRETRIVYDGDDLADVTGVTSTVTTPSALIQGGRGQELIQLNILAT
jgi:hypothetical protein